MEIWKDINGYVGLYKISNKGIVKSLPKIRYLKDKILVQDFTSCYARVRLFSNGKGKFLLVHRLVALNFLENKNNKTQVNHIDGNKRNNNLENLEWTTKSENSRHAWRTGLMENTRKASVINGKKLAEGKYYKDKERSIYQFDKSNKLMNEFNSISQASRQLKINLGNIASNCRGERKSSGGYIFKFVK